MSQFVPKTAVSREVLDWGVLGWTNHPPLTGTKHALALENIGKYGVAPFERIRKGAVGRD